MIVFKLILIASFFFCGVISQRYPAVCPVGILGEFATLVACDVQHIYCKIEFLPFNNYTYGSCASRCVTGLTNVNCYSPGLDIDNSATTCLVGDLFGGVGAIPARCPTNFNFCRNTRTVNGNLTTANFGSCADRCTPILAGANPTTTVQCFTGELSNKLGPLCYVGTFGVNAGVVGCPENYLCQYNPIGYSGSCVQTCSSLSTCTNADLLNKQGPICYVGQFGVNAKVVACLANQFCQYSTVQNIITGQYTLGSCVTSCQTTSTSNCCSTDLCNSYKILYLGVLSNANKLFGFKLYLIILLSICRF